MEWKTIGSIYTDVSENFQHGPLMIARTVKAEKHDLGVIQMKVNQLGNIMPTMTRDNPNQGRVYDKNGVSPSINCMEGGGREPMIIDVKCLNTKDENGKQPPQQDRVYETDGLMTSIMAEQAGRFHILEKTIVAMRGRNPKNPSDRTPGAATEQRLEPNMNGVSNTITSVQKDNLVMERNYEMQGKNFNQRNTVHGKNGVCRTILGNGHAGNEPKVIVDNEVVWGGLQEHQSPRTDGICPSITAACGMGGGQTPVFSEKTETVYRIRKLTPRECGRLMDVSDDDISKMAEVNSNSQLYKQFGNSIVKRCMVAMFSNLRIQGLPRWEDIKGRYV